VKKPGEFDVVGQVEWLREERRRKKSDRAMFCWSFGAPFLFAALYLAIIVLTVKLKSAAPEEGRGGTYTFSGTGLLLTPSIIDGGLVRYQPVTEAAVLQAFHAATKAWAKALGGKLPIRYPRLLRSQEGDCLNPGVLAYAEDPDKVVVCRLFSEDTETIMLHEVGHLLGVPHIQGDDLMDAAAHGATLRQPSPAAIALAKLAHPKKEK
jgi:hypothetical protein